MLELLGNGMGEKPTIAFRVGQEQKDRWDDAVDDNPEYDSLSHLIRRAVERELAGGYDPTGGTTQEDPRIDSVLEQVESIDAHLDGLNDSIERLEDRTYAEGGISDETLEAVFSEIPIGEGNAVGGDSGSPSTIAEKTGFTESKTEMALEQLRNDIVSVERVDFTGDDLIYFRDP